MLTLTRKVGESIEIDGGITVTVKRISGSKVQIGIAAPDETGIVRSELVAEQSENGISKEASRMDCEGQDAPFSKKIWTTGELARLLKVAPRTVCKWCDSGRMKHYKIPGTFDRRIPTKHVVEFCKDHGMPIPDGVYEKPKLDHEPLLIGGMFGP